MIDAIKICSEYPSKCFYLQEALSQLGYWHVFSYEDKLNASMQVTSMGSAVLVEEGFGGGVAVTTKARKERFIGENVACEYLGRHDNNSGVA